MASLEATTSSADLQVDSDAPTKADGSLASGSGESVEEDDRILVEEENVGDMDSEQSQDSWVDIGDPRNEAGKRVKVYELRDSSWFDRGTGQCKGVYDDRLDVALLIVEAEDAPKAEGGAAEGEQDEPGGFLRDGEGEPQMLLRSRVEKADCYSKQQDTLIVWTEPNGVDIALSFQDADGCEDIWAFITEVQRHLNNMPEDVSHLPSSSSPMSTSPVLGHSVMGMSDQTATWTAPNLSNIREQEAWLRSQAKSAVTRGRAVEHIIGDDFIKQLISILHQAEDLESLDDLHALCSLMHTIILLNDNGVFEYILHDDVFMGVVGMLEYDPEFPTLKASYRQFLSENTRFREVVEIKDDAIRTKIHQTYRLLYLKDVVLARVLDDPTFNILNSFVFFNQSDIITHIQGNDALLRELFAGFREERDDKTDGDPDTNVNASGSGQPADDRKRDVVLFLHQLMLMGKNVQVASRLQLYRTLLERGLLFVCEWAFRRQEQSLLHAGAEILTLAVEHDVGAVRMHVLKEEEQHKRTLVKEMIDLLINAKDLGLKSQMTDTLRTLLELKTEGTEPFTRQKEGPISENFVQYFYESCCASLFEPVMELPDFKKINNTALSLSRETGALLHSLTELLSFCIVQHAHRSQYYVLSNPISIRVVTLLSAKEKSLRHVALKYIKACLKSNNHFMHRYIVKNDLVLPILDLLRSEGSRDNMLTSACMDVFDMIRSQNIKPIIQHIFDKHKSRIEELTEKPTLAAFMRGLTARWEQNNEPLPGDSVGSTISMSKSAAAEQEDYFNADSDEEIGPQPPATLSLQSPSQQKRKRQRAQDAGGMPPAKKSSASEGNSFLGLDYDDESDSDGSSGSPRRTAGPVLPTASVSKTAGLAPSPMALDDMATEAPAVPSASEEELQEIEQKMRAKRMREEQDEEEGLALGGAAKAAKATPPKEEAEKGKKIKLSLSLGKKLS